MYICNAQLLLNADIVYAVFIYIHICVYVIQIHVYIQHSCMIDYVYIYISIYIHEAPCGRLGRWPVCVPSGDGPPPSLGTSALPTSSPESSQRARGLRLLGMGQRNQNVSGNDATLAFAVEVNATFFLAEFPLAILGPLLHDAAPIALGPEMSVEGLR